MTKAKWEAETRGMNVDATLIALARRIQSGRDKGAKLQALRSALGQVLHLVHAANWQPAEMYRLANSFVLEDNDAKRDAAIEHFVNVIDAQIPKVSKNPDRLALTVAMTRLLHDAEFTAPEIAELIDDGHGGTAEQRQARARSRFSANTSKNLEQFWASLDVNEKAGTPNSP